MIFYTHLSVQYTVFIKLCEDTYIYICTTLYLSLSFNLCNH